MKLIDTNRYFLPGQSRFLHLATVTNGIREAHDRIIINHTYICFADTQGEKKIYIEELAAGQLQFIEEDKVAAEIAQFLTEAGILDVTRPLLDDNTWLRNGR